MIAATLQANEVYIAMYKRSFQSGLTVSVPVEFCLHTCCMSSSQPVLILRAQTICTSVICTSVTLVAICLVLDFTACAASSCSSWCHRCPLSQTVLVFCWDSLSHCNHSHAHTGLHDILEGNSSWTCLFVLDLCQSVGGEGSKWLSLSGKHSDLLLLLSCMMVFSILLHVRCCEYISELISRLIMWLIGQAKCNGYLVNTDSQHSIHVLLFPLLSLDAEQRS